MNQDSLGNKQVNTVDKTIAEALLMANFFTLAHQGQDALPTHDLNEKQVEVAKEYLIQPIGIEVFRGPIAGDNRRN